MTDTTDPTKPVGMQWCAFENGEQRTSWHPEGLGDCAGWKALSKRYPSEYEVVERYVYSPSLLSEYERVKAERDEASADLDACQKQAVKDGNEIASLKAWQAGAISCREAEQARIDEATARSEALEAEVKRLREALLPFSRMAGEMFARNWNAKQIVTALDNPERENRVTTGDFFKARAALEASR